MQHRPRHASHDEQRENDKPERENDERDRCSPPTENRRSLSRWCRREAGKKSPRQLLEEGETKKQNRREDAGVLSDTAVRVGRLRSAIRPGLLFWAAPSAHGGCSWMKVKCNGHWG